MSPEHPDDRERVQQRPSTWWVGRGTEPRPWWTALLPPLLFGCWLTFAFFASQEERSLWLLALFWVAPGAYIGWILWCHATGRDELARRVDRWGDEHPAMGWMIVGGLVVACLVLWLLRN